MDNYFWETSSDTAGTENAKVNNWLWQSEIAKGVPCYDENGSPYIYFLVEGMRGNSYGYQASYYNAPNGESNPNGAAKTTEGTFDVENENLDSSILLIDDGTENTYPCVVVNTRQQEAEISGRKTWSIAGALMYAGPGGIPFEDMPDVTLTLYRRAASADQNGKYVAPVFDAEQAERIETVTIKGADKTNYSYSFPSEKYKKENHLGEDYKLPRYNEYGYRYTYWLTEDPITSYESGNMEPEGTSGDAVVFKPEADNFDITNTFKVEPPYVKISLDKEWSWPESIDEGKKNLTVTFELHAVMADEKGELIGGSYGDQIFAEKSITLKNGKPDETSLAFIKATKGPFIGENLPYYAPNGKPYQYYIKEIHPDGYEVSVKVTTSPETGNFLSKIIGKASDMMQKVISLFSNSEEAAKYGDTGLIKPELAQAGDEASEVKVEYTNTYTGDDFYALNVQKIWNDYEAPFTTNSKPNLHPDSITVKLYRQWKISGTEYAWEQVTKPDDSSIGVEEDSGWQQMDLDGVLTLKAGDTDKETGWKLLSDLGGLYRIAPNGNLYEYFVVEQGDIAGESGDHGYIAAKSSDTHPDVTDSTSPTKNMQTRRGYSNSVILNGDAQVAAVKPSNELIYKGVTYSKQWKKQVDGETSENLTQDEAKTLVALGALPENLYFVVQYKTGDSGEWYYLPRKWDQVGTSGTTLDNLKQEAIKNFVYEVYSSDPKAQNTYITDNMRVQNKWNYLPAYYYDDNDNAPQEGQEITYRIVEVMEFAKQNQSPNELVICDPENTLGTTTEDGNITSSLQVEQQQPVPQNLPKLNNTTYSYTNTVKVKPLVIRKIWEGDNANRDNTRPNSITINIKPKNSKLAGIDVNLSREDIKNGVNKPDTNETYQDGNVYQSKTYYVLASQIPDIDNTKLQVTEISNIENYTTSDEILLTEETADEKTTYVFTATNTLEDTTRKTIDLTATKAWSGDAGWAEITRPTVEFTLQYRYKPNNGEAYTEWTEAAAGKTWAKPEDGKEGENATKEVTGSNNDNSYTVEWKNVYQYYEEDGSAYAIPIEYRVVEKIYVSDKTDGTTEIVIYTQTGDGVFSTSDTSESYNTTITNTLQTVNVGGQKEWKWNNGNTNDTFSDEEVEDLIDKGVLPSYLLFELYYQKSGEIAWRKADDNVFPPVIKKTLDILRNTFTVTEKKLPKYDSNGKELQYRLVETGVYFGSDEPKVTNDFEKKTQWTSEITAGTVGCFDVTVSSTGTQTATTNTLPVGSLTVTKDWEDYDNRDGKRPASIEIELYRDGEATAYATATLNAGNNWSYTWDDLPIYKNEMEPTEENKSKYKVEEK